jgi:3-hydroxybutyryl-CoA dehydrogenase
MGVTDQTVAVLGAGAMGTGITRILLEAGYRVRLADVRAAALEAACRKAGSGRLQTFVGDGAAIDGCGVVIDATPQGAARKAGVLRTVALRTGPDVLIGTVTLGTPVAELDVPAHLRPRLVGLHFMNPPHALRFCELVVPAAASAPAVDRARSLLDAIGVTRIEVPDTSGFVLNRALVPFLFTAVRLLEQGVASAADIDLAFVRGCGHPMGPLAIVDLVGIDVAIALGEQLVPTAGEECRPPGLLYTLAATGGRLRDDGAR